MICSQLRRQDWPMVGYLPSHLASNSRRFFLGNLHGFGPIDGLEIGGYFLAVLPGHKTQAVTHQMHDASLDLGLREYAVNSLGEAP